MKFFLFAGVASAALTARTLQDVLGALSSISSATTQLQSGINSFQGAGQVSQLTTASENVIAKTKAATTTVQNSADLSSTDALQLPPPVQSLGTLVQDTVTALINKKPLFASLGVCSVVEMQSQQISSAAQTFSTTLLSKIPMALQSIGKGLAAPITQNLSKAVAAFQSCPAGSMSGSMSSSMSMSGSMMSSSMMSAPATTSSAPAMSSSMSAPSYPSGSAPASSVPASSAPATSSVAPASSVPASSAPAPAYTGAASHNAAGFGAAAVAAVAVLAL